MKKTILILLLFASAASADRSISFRDFLLDYRDLEKQHAIVTFGGTYARVGAEDLLFADSQEYIRFANGEVGTPYIGLAIADADRGMRATLLDCRSNSVTSQLGCAVWVKGSAAGCVNGIEQEIPCINVSTGGSGRMPEP
jgi:hypothetical protein